MRVVGAEDTVVKVVGAEDTVVKVVGEEVTVDGCKRQAWGSASEYFRHFFSKAAQDLG